MNSTKENPVEIIRTRSDLQARVRAWKQAGETVGFVPTMGALHEGHLSLIEKAQEKTKRTVASIFVNPTQFAPGEDFDTYPRRESEDIAKLASVQCDAVYLPTVAEMYPEGSVTNVRVESLSDLLDGIYRPHFFYGVATVVARLFLHAQPDVAVFGEKDYQQLQVIRRMVRDLGFPIEIIGGVTRRDADGLAQSSRNLYLSADQRRAAGAIYSAMHRAAMRMSLGALPGDALKEAEGYILASGFAKIDYVTLVDPATLQAAPMDQPLAEGTVARLLAAAWIGKTRLIDNISVTR
ncbi:MAG: pantoate--beta-alanine ligase [Hyphomonas sp.]